MPNHLRTRRPVHSADIAAAAAAAKAKAAAKAEAAAVADGIMRAVSLVCRHKLKLKANFESSSTYYSFKRRNQARSTWGQPAVLHCLTLGFQWLPGSRSKSCLMGAHGVVMGWLGGVYDMCIRGCSGGV